jgi:FkbM family methyltransferase
MGGAGEKIKQSFRKEFMSIKTLLIKIVNKVPFRLRSRVKNIPGLKQIQSYLLRRWINNDEFVAAISGGPAKGLIFPVQMPQDKLMWIGTWELDFAKALSQYVQPRWVCYDIGGYKGYYAGIMALKGAAEVFVFEPMPANAEKIQKMIELNAALPIRLKQVAVSDTTGKTVFKIMPEETMGKLENSSFQKNDKEITQITVDCITLDDLIKNGLPEPDFIKIDVEGAEEFVLKGAIELLEKRPFLMIEVHSPAIGKRCLAVLKNFYSTITVFETGQKPEMGAPEICHYIAFN